jgi:hypothetical protein
MPPLSHSPATPLHALRQLATLLRVSRAPAGQAQANVARAATLLAEAGALLESTAALLTPGQAADVDAAALGAAQACATAANALADIAADLTQSPDLRFLAAAADAHPRQLCALL